MVDVVYAARDCEVSVEEEVKGGGVNGEDQSKAEASVCEEVEGWGSKGEENKDEAAVDAKTHSEASVKEGGEDGGNKGKVERREDEEEDGESSEASSSGEGEEEEESSEASSSSDEEEQKGKKHGGVGDMSALIAEGELMVGINDDEDEEEEEACIDSKHEVEVLPPVPKIEIQLEPHHKALPVGTISSIMGERLIVEGSVEHNPLNEGSILWITESRIPLGIVEELFGPVKNPYYLVRYNSVEEVPAGISAGTAVSFVIEFADHILNLKELYTKGYDESGDNVEDQTDDPEFSDDEKEAEYRRSLRMGKRQTHKQLECKKHSGNKKRKQRRDAGFHKDMPPRIQDSETPGHQSKQHFHRSDMVPAADNSARMLGPQSIRTSLQIATPSVSVNPSMESAIHFADQKGGCFPNPSQQFLLQQPNVVWPGGFPSPMYPNMGINGAALAANMMQNILSAASQYQQHYHNQGFGGFPNGMPIAPTQFMPQNRVPANPMQFGGPPVNPPFGPSESGMGQGNSYNLGHLAGNLGQMPPGLPNAEGYGSMPPSHGDGGQYPMQFNSGQFNLGNSSFYGRPPHQGGRHSPGRGGGGHHK